MTVIWFYDGYLTGLFNWSCTVIEKEFIELPYNWRKLRKNCNWYYTCASYQHKVDPVITDKLMHAWHQLGMDICFSLQSIHVSACRNRWWIDRVVCHNMLSCSTLVEIFVQFLMKVETDCNLFGQVCICCIHSQCSVLSRTNALPSLESVW